MKKDNFAGWRDVFSFSIQQMTNGLAFRSVTALIAILLIAGMIIINVVIASITKEEISTIEKVFVLDDSGLAETPFEQMLPIIAKDKYDKIKFEYKYNPNDSMKKIVLEAASFSEKAVVLHITKEKSEYIMEIAIPQESEIKKSEAKKLLKDLVSCFENNKIMQIGLNVEQVQVVAKPIITSVSEAGEAVKSTGEYIVEMIAPMLLSMILYFMIYQYGGKTCSSIVTEKTSKLIELLLTAVHPNALILGKVLASTCISMFQLFLWMISGIIGYLVGDKIALSIYSEYENPLFVVFDLIKANTTHGVFSLGSIILAVLILFIGFFFYSVVAGSIGSVLNKPEQVALGIQIYAFPLTIAWMIAYFAPITENTVFINIVRLVPFTAPFMVPADLIVGSMSIGMGCITLLLLMITTWIFVVITGRLYRGLILYNGNKLTMGKVWKMVTAK